MKKPLAAALSLALVVTFYPAVAPAAGTCADVETAKSVLKKQTVAMQNTQAPRSLAGARSQDIQAPRSQGVQAPRSVELKQAATLVKEADAACMAGNSSLATVKPNAAMELLNK